MLKRQLYTDVTMTVQGQSFQAHRAVHEALLEGENKTYCAIKSGVNSVISNEAWELGLGICCCHQVWFMAADELAIFGHYNIALNKRRSLDNIQGEWSCRCSEQACRDCRDTHSCLC